MWQINLMIIIIFFLAILKLSEKYRNISFWFYLFILSFSIGTLYLPEYVGIGGDWHVYRIGFETITESLAISNDFTFDILNRVIRMITDNYSITFYIYILIINFIFLKAVYNYSKNIEFSIIIYVTFGVYITSTNITRQIFATVIFFHSIKYLSQKEYLKFILFNFIGMGFHITAMIPTIITLFLYKFKKYLYNYLFRFLLFLQFMIIFEPLITSLGINLVYENYQNNDFSYGSNGLHYVIQVLLIIFYMIIKNNKISENEKLYLLIVSFATLFNFYALKMVLYARISLYFSIFHTILIPNLLSNLNIKVRRILTYLLIVFLILYYFILSSQKIKIFHSHFFDYLNQEIYNVIQK